ncbi:hypothetical protein [Mycolicibacterium fortuitum]|nr:hypothetical protein [Mycolicibacterium fortuitum]
MEQGTPFVEEFIGPRDARQRLTIPPAGSTHHRDQPKLGVNLSEGAHTG